MPIAVIELQGTRIYECSAAGPCLRSGQDAVDLMSLGRAAGAELVAVPVGRFDAEFFRLATRQAGEFLQKFVMYGARLAIVGDLQERLEASASLRALVAECNRGQQVWFVQDRAALEERLSAPGESTAGAAPSAIAGQTS